ncbi:MAG: hypothetical protein F4Y87_08465 [Synechococcus sp. SB0665_bin_28]|nr:hypothetical protein [Synechococcus sp. SB0665_bin_28]
MRRRGTVHGQHLRHCWGPPAVNICNDQWWDAEGSATGAAGRGSSASWTPRHQEPTPQGEQMGEPAWPMGERPVCKRNP